jgi:hypothetical protein
MAKYFLNSEPNQRRIKYFDLDVSTTRGITPEPKYQLDVCFNLTGSVEIVK